MLMKNLIKQTRQKKANKMIQNKKNQKLMKDIRQKIQNYLKGLMAKKGGNGDPVDTGIELDTNVAKNKKLSTYDSVARAMDRKSR